MPYIKRTETPFIKMRRLLLGYELDATRLARVLECAYGTAKSRLDHPENFTLAELDMINTRGHIPIEEIRAAMIR